MSQAEDLLNSLTAEDEVEEHIVIGKDRFITVPQSLKKIAVQFDNNVRTVTFDCPRYSDGRDLSTMAVSVNYLRPDGEPGLYSVGEVTIDDLDSSIMHFDWVIEDDVTAVNGTLSFLICAKKTNSDGINENHWNTELNQEMTISKGLNCTESIIKRYPDLIAQILTRLDDAEVEVNAAKEEANSYTDQNTSALLKYIQSIVKPYNIIWTDGGYISKDDGSVNAEEGSSYSDFVKVEPGSKLIITNTMETDTDYNVFCDSSRNYISSFSTNNGSVITTPENASYFRLSKKTNDTVTILPEINWMEATLNVETDKTLTQEGVPADSKITGEKITELKTDISQLSEDIYTTESYDLFPNIIYSREYSGNIGGATYQLKEDASLILNGEQIKQSTIYVTEGQNETQEIGIGRYAYGMCDESGANITLENFTIIFQVIVDGVRKYYKNNTVKPKYFTIEKDGMYSCYITCGSGNVYDNEKIYLYLNKINDDTNIDTYIPNYSRDSKLEEKVFDLIKKPKKDGEKGDVLLNDGENKTSWGKMPSGSEFIKKPEADGTAGDVLINDGEGKTAWGKQYSSAEFIKASDNLIPIKKQGSIIQKGITFTVNDDKTITIDGTSESQIVFVLTGETSSIKYPIEKGVYRFLNTGGNSIEGISIQTVISTESSGYIYKNATTDNPWILDGDGEFYVQLIVQSGKTFDNKKIYLHLVKGLVENEYRSYDDTNYFDSCMDASYQFFNKLNAMGLVPFGISKIINTPIFTWIDDDYWTNATHPKIQNGNAEKVKEICDNNEIKCTFAVPLGQAKKEGVMKQILEWQGEGFHFSCHDGGIECVSFLQKNGVIDSNYNVAPGGTKTLDYQQSVMAWSECNVNSGGGIGYTKYVGNGRYNIDRQFMDKTQETRFKKYIDMASVDGGWIVAGTHSNNSGNNWDPDVVDRIIKYAKEKGMIFMTLSQALRYRRSIYNLYELFTPTFFKE